MMTERKTMDSMPPDPAIEFAVIVLMAQLAMMGRRRRRAFVGMLHAVSQDLAEDGGLTVLSAERTQALREARREARTWLEAYLPAMLEG